MQDEVLYTNTHILVSNEPSHQSQRIGYEQQRLEKSHLERPSFSDMIDTNDGQQMSKRLLECALQLQETALLSPRSLQMIPFPPLYLALTASATL